MDCKYAWADCPNYREGRCVPLTNQPSCGVWRVELEEEVTSMGRSCLNCRHYAPDMEFPRIARGFCTKYGRDRIHDRPMPEDWCEHFARANYPMYKTIERMKGRMRG